MSWAQKYAPSSLSELTLNRKGVREILKWISSFYEYKKKRKKTSKKTKDASAPKSCLLILGNHGIGKTKSVSIVAKGKGFDLKELRFGHTKITLDPPQLVQALLRSRNLFHRTSKKEKILVMVDNLSSISSTLDKSKIRGLVKLNKVEYNFPIILIANKLHSKFINEIKKESQIVNFNSPSLSELFSLSSQILKKEELRFEKSTDYQKILNFCQGDLRQLFSVLQTLGRSANKGKILASRVERFLASTKAKSVDKSLFEAARQLLTHSMPPLESMQCYDTDKSLVPLMLHQNYVMSLLRLPKKRHLETAKKITRLLSQGDVTENYIHGDQNWDLQKIHGFYTCVLPSFYLNHVKSLRPMFGKLNFAVDLNRTSTQKINNKNILSLSGDLNESTLLDYLFRSEVLFYLVSSDIHRCVKRLKSSELAPNRMEDVLKVNKMLQKEHKSVKEKSLLPNKTKRELLALCAKEGF